MSRPEYLTGPLLDDRRPNAVDDQTRIHMAAFDRSVIPDHWVSLYGQLVQLGASDLVAASTAMAHLTNAEVRALLAFLVGYDAQLLRERDEPMPDWEREMLNSPPDDVTVLEATASGLVKLACKRCPYTGALSTRTGAIAAAWTHHRTHERTRHG